MRDAAPRVGLALLLHRAGQDGSGGRGRLPGRGPALDGLVLGHGHGSSGVPPRHPSRGQPQPRQIREQHADEEVRAANGGIIGTLKESQIVAGEGLTRVDRRVALEGPEGKVDSWPARYAATRRPLGRLRLRVGDSRYRNCIARARPRAR